MSDYAYKAGLARGVSGKSSGSGMFSDMFDNKKEKKARSDGFRAGARIRAAKNKKK